MKAQVAITPLVAGLVLLGPHASLAAPTGAKCTVEGQSLTLVQMGPSGPAGVGCGWLRLLP